jgi:hypothetical protein
MRNNAVLFITLSFLTTSLFLNSSAQADIEWSGVYRIEAININNPDLGGKRFGDANTHGKREQNYALSHLVLRPKIVASDGLTIYGQFDIFNNAAYPNSQLGQTWGSGVNTGTAPDSTGQSNTLSSNQKAESIQVSQLYLTLTQEYGSLVAGRVPLQFGLGMTHSAGRGLFDHWYDTDDLVGYKFVFGNLWVMPMVGKNAEGNINMNSDDVNDWMIQAEYENPETDISAGVFYKLRQGGDGTGTAGGPVSMGGDGAAGAGSEVLGGTGAKNSGKVNMKTVSLFILKDTPRYRLGMEATFQSGETGVVTTGGTGDNVTMGGYGVAAEFEYRPEESKWKWGLKAGLASGDDPTTPGKFDGFIFNRNYDVAMLMFNHPLGADDFMRTRLVTGNVRDPNKDIAAADVEAISNAIYAAPSARYNFSDRWSVDNTLITGWLTTNPLGAGNDPGKNLGFEWDLSVNFTPRKGVMWVNQAGMLFPGQVWKGNGNYDASFGFGVQTKAAISF